MTNICKWLKADHGKVAMLVQIIFYRCRLPEELKTI